MRVACLKRSLACSSNRNGFTGFSTNSPSLPGPNVAPPPLITGDDLTAAGLQPGKLFKRILNEAYDAQLEDRIASKEEAMKLALQIAGSTLPR